ncbi:hypothetical protein BpHYR1_034290 [Brachionus plicatilis]|uniref:Uncharacterized protein n=1 Tax=Brachionus plicatilis TaxID=10195 RepID=A0A3M7RUQ1_BRAPC|nr:hypothetical protein BpHYR1_034290 [Brachionus plicatilis]
MNNLTIQKEKKSDLLELKASESNSKVESTKNKHHGSPLSDPFFDENFQTLIYVLIHFAMAAQIESFQIDENKLSLPFCVWAASRSIWQFFLFCSCKLLRQICGQAMKKLLSPFQDNKPRRFRNMKKVRLGADENYQPNQRICQNCNKKKQKKTH